MTSLIQKGKKQKEQVGYSDILFAAENNLGPAQYWLAKAFLKGKYDINGACKIRQNIRNGIQWLEKAVKNNNVKAILLMADFHRTGAYKQGIYNIRNDIDRIIKCLKSVQDKNLPITDFFVSSLLL